MSQKRRDIACAQSVIRGPDRQRRTADETTIIETVQISSCSRDKHTLLERPAGSYILARDAVSVMIVADILLIGIDSDYIEEKEVSTRKRAMDAWSAEEVGEGNRLEYMTSERQRSLMFRRRMWMRKICVDPNIKSAM